MKQTQAVKQSKDGQSDASEKNSFGEVLATKKQNQAQSSASCQKDAKANKKNQAESHYETEGCINAEVLPNMTVSDGSPPARLRPRFWQSQRELRASVLPNLRTTADRMKCPSGVTASFTTAVRFLRLLSRNTIRCAAEFADFCERTCDFGEHAIRRRTKISASRECSVQNVPEQSGKKFDFAESASVSSQKNADAAAKAQSGSVIQENGTGTETAMTQNQPHESHAIDVLNGVIAKQSDSDENHTDGGATQKHSIAVLENNIQRMSSGMQTIKVSDSSNEIESRSVHR
jgi:hypothetical protein